MSRLTIAVIGASGVVGGPLTEFFESQDPKYRVIRVEKGDSITEAARQSDVVFIAILPIESTAGVIHEAASVMRPGTALLHCTSVEHPVEPGVIDTEYVASRGVCLGHFHPHFRPQSPFARSIRGQVFTVDLPRTETAKKWRRWIRGEFGKRGAVIKWLKEGQHDQLTSVSQLVHMLFAVIGAWIWQHLPVKTIRGGVEIGGPPCQLLVRMLLRVSGAPRVIASILVNHPQVTKILAMIEEAIRKVRQAVEARDEDWIVTVLSGGRRVLDPEFVKETDQTTAMLALLEANARHAHYRLEFSSEENEDGLLELVSREFKLRQCGLVSFIGYDTPEGGCVFALSVKSKNRASEEAAEAVRSRRWTK